MAAVRGFVRGLYSQLLVVYALALRETRTRFGAHHMGYLWAILEPALTILTFFVIFKVAKRGVDGLDLWGFIATGVIPYTLFSNTATQVSNAISGNKPLLFYPHIQPLDLMLARVSLEFATYVVVFIVLTGGHALILQHIEVDNVLYIIIGMMMAALLGAAVGLVFCCLAEVSRVADRARGPLLRPLFWISGIFFIPEQLPEVARNVVLVNPVLHVVELVRDGYFATYNSQHLSIPYVMAWILGTLLVGLLLERGVRRRIEVT
jgi:capsular polysaccharide transport system permease protein